MDETLKKLQDIANADAKKTFTPDRAKEVRKFLGEELDSNAIYNKLLCDTFLKAVGTYCVYQSESDDGMARTAMDGIYREVSSDETTMLYELIQNADDAFTDNPNEHLGTSQKLDIDFEFNKNTLEKLARITLEYNESGFSPGDVFSLCTIGHSTKTRDPSKRPIGHKGVGFKSMFKIIDSVWIQSGYFSFKLRSNNKGAETNDGKNITKEGILVPEIQPDDGLVNGTRITIYMEHKLCNSLYNNCVQRFFQEKAVFESNPLLFLRNITSISLKCGENTTTFTKTISNIQEPDSQDLEVKKGNRLSIQVNSEKPKMYTFDLYTRKVPYDIELYKERYPGMEDYTGYEKYPFETYSAAVLSCDTSENIPTGGLYAGLPTKVRTTVPISLDIPFFLDLSRSYPDNTYAKWTEHTHSQLNKFLESVYLSLAEDKKTKIVKYLPKITESFFRYEKDLPDSGSLKVLMIDQDGQIRYQGAWIDNLKIFYVNGSPEFVNNIYCFRAKDHIEDQENVSKWLFLRSKIFYTPDYTDMSSFGCSKYVDDVKNELFKICLNRKDTFKDIINWHEKHIENMNSRGIDVDRNNYYSESCLSDSGSYKQLDESAISTVLTYKSLGNVKIWQQLTLAYALVHNNKLKETMNWIKTIDAENISLLFENNPELNNIQLRREQIKELFENPKLIGHIELQKLLFRTVTYSLDDFEYILEKLKEIKNIKYSDLFPETEISLDKKLIKILLKHDELTPALSEMSKKAIDSRRRQYSFKFKSDDFETIDPTVSSEIKKVERGDLDEEFVNYLTDRVKKEFNRNMVVIDNGMQPCCLLCSNGMILAEGHEYASLANLVSNLKLEKPGSFFSCRLKLKEIYGSLNKYDTDVLCDEEYLVDLSHKKEYEYEAAASLFGSSENSSENGINKLIIPNVPITKFISELLQNAQDAEYDNNITPTFELKLKGDSVEIITNEKGFMRKHVKAITDIGNSTKKACNEMDYLTIGNKGVGFKTVFTIADCVEIHSLNAHFKIEKKRPIVPIVMREQEKSDKTHIILKLKNTPEEREKIIKEITTYLDNKNNLLNLCICLGKLKEITLDKHNIAIKNDRERRIITIDGKSTYDFSVFTETVTIDDTDALTDRYGENASKTTPKKVTLSEFLFNGDSKDIQYLLHTGLPINPKYYSEVPILFDLPLDLDDNRETILKNKWNALITANAYKLYAGKLKSKITEGFGLFKFINENWALFSSAIVSDTIDTIEGMPIADYLINNIKQIKFVPVFGEQEKYENPSACQIIDKSFLEDRDYSINKYVAKNIVDTTLKTADNYLSKLKKLGAEEVDPDHIATYLIDHIKDFSQIKKTQCRSGIYRYISKIKNAEIRRNIVTNVKMFPLRTTKGTIFDVYKNSLYVESSDYSEPDEDHPLLDTSIIQKDLANTILTDIGECTVLDWSRIEIDYREKIKNKIDSATPDKYEEVAEFLRKEFETQTNQKLKEAFNEILFNQYTQKKNLPLKREDGSFNIGESFLNREINGKGRYAFEGTLLRSLIIHKSYEEMAIAFGAKNVIDIDEQSFDVDKYELSTLDLVDLANTDIKRRVDIIYKFDDKNKIPLILSTEKDDEDTNKNVFEEIKTLILDYTSKAGEVFRLLTNVVLPHKLMMRNIPLLRMDGKIRKGNRIYSKEINATFKGDYFKKYCLDQGQFSSKEVKNTFISIFKPVAINNLKELDDSDTDLITDKDIEDIIENVEKYELLLGNIRDKSRIELVNTISNASLPYDTIFNRILKFDFKDEKVSKGLRTILYDNCSSLLPCRMMDGSIHPGDKFIILDGKQPKGNLIKKCVIDKELKDFSKFINIPDVKTIEYDQLVQNNEYISDDDLNDIFDLDLQYKEDIIKEASRNGRFRIINDIEQLIKNPPNPDDNDII